MDDIFGLSASEQLSDERAEELIERFAKEVVERNLTAPVIFLLESSKPFTFLGSQALVFLSPIVQSIFEFKSYNDIRLMLENRENVEKLIQKIEAMDVEFREKLKRGEYEYGKEEKGGFLRWLLGRKSKKG
ncbi:MAG TPA: hypothetical protein ENI43_01675 [Firmicutes bacterium]|nr:hypothetical protein [Bacillota bacterium]